jgi:putative PIN family toxin of toxin-antitoxin system
MKIVFDTNVYVGIGRRDSAARKAFDATLVAGWRVYISDYILNELERVLIDDLGRPFAIVAAYRRELEAHTRRVIPIPSRHIVQGDPKDTDILRTAIAAGADYLVSNDKHFLSLHPYEGLRIVSLASYYRVLQNQELI